MMIQRLIANGHPPEQVREYPLQKIVAFNDAITSLERINKPQQFMHSVLAAQGTPDAISKELTNLIER